MKLTGFRRFASWKINHFDRKITHNAGKLILCGKAVYDVTDTAKITLSDGLILNANLRKGSKAECYLKISCFKGCYDRRWSHHSCRLCGY